MKVKLSELKSMIREAVSEQIDPPAKVSADAAAVAKKQEKVSGLETATKKINTPQEGSQAILAAVASYGLDKRGQIQALVMAVNALRGGQGGVSEGSVKEQSFDDATETSDESDERTLRWSKNWGTMPSVEEIEEALDGEEYDVDLKGQDSLAMDYAVTLSDEPLAGIFASPRSILATLEALVNAPVVNDLSDEQYEEVKDLLDSWYERYGDLSINDATESLAASIMQTLGFEWV